MYYLYPLLLCLIPVHAVFAQNIGEISVSNYAKATAVSGLLITAACFGLNLFLHNLYLSELIVCINFFMLLYANYAFIALFSEYKRTLMHIKSLFTAGYLLTGIGISYFLYLASNFLNLEIVSKVLFYISGVLTVFILADIASRLSKYSFESVKIEEKTYDENLPDIYHILADGHSGFDCKEYYDDYFKTELEKRGFHIYEKARSNYNVTHMSVPSMLNMEHIRNLVPGTETHCTPSQTWHLYSKNRVFDELKKLGYRFHFVLDKHFLYLHKDVYIGANDYINPENYKTQTSLLYPLLFSSIFKLSNTFSNQISKKADFNKDILELLKDYIRLSKNTSPRPMYNFMHILAPHNPYFVDENGTKIPKAQLKNHTLYFSYQKYINKQLLKLIDNIKSNMKSNSIIILHSDHNICYPSIPKKEFFNILLAVHYPDKEMHKCIPENVTLINLFSHIFNTFFGKNYPFKSPEFYETNITNYETVKFCMKD